MYKGSIPAEDIYMDAQCLGITPEQFVDVYLEKEEYDMNYQTKHKPCDFLQEDGNCKLETVNRIVAKNIHILISQRDCQVC